MKVNHKIHQIDWKSKKEISKLELKSASGWTRAWKNGFTWFRILPNIDTKDKKLTPDEGIVFNGSDYVHNAKKISDMGHNG